MEDIRRQRGAWPVHSRARLLCQAYSLDPAGSDPPPGRHTHPAPSACRGLPGGAPHCPPETPAALGPAPISPAASCPQPAPSEGTGLTAKPARLPQARAPGTTPGTRPGAPTQSFLQGPRPGTRPGAPAQSFLQGPGRTHTHTHCTRQRGEHGACSGLSSYWVKPVSTAISGSSLKAPTHSGTEILDSISRDGRTER